MIEHTLAQLQHIRLAVLTTVVQQDQRRSSLITTDWAVQPFCDKGVVNAGELWSLNGHAHDGSTRHLRVVAGAQDPAPPIP